MFCDSGVISSIFLSSFAFILIMIPLFYVKVANSSINPPPGPQANLRKRFAISPPRCHGGTFSCRSSDCSKEAELGTGKGLAIENGKNCNRPAPVGTEARRACRLSDCSDEAELGTGKGLAIENGKRFAISPPRGHGGTFSCRSSDCSKEAELRTGKDLQSLILWTDVFRYAFSFQAFGARPRS